MEQSLHVVCQCLETLGVPRQRRPPARLTEDCDAYEAMSVSMQYCRHFFEAIDTAVSELKERFLESDGLKSYAQLETVLLSGNVDHAKQYHELSAADLELELIMFLRKNVVYTRVINQSYTGSSFQATRSIRHTCKQVQRINAT